jgi:parallel beta-helix repeat protein/YD repeat-containing protein
MMKFLFPSFPFLWLGSLPIFSLRAAQRFLLGLLAFFLFCSCSSLALAVPGGDLAPRGAPDGQLDVGDLVILEQFVFGILTPTADEFKIGDVAPLGNPDNQLNAADVVLLQRAIFGEVTLPDVQLDPSTLSGNLNTSKPLAAGTYSVTGNITVPAGQTLTIQPGAILKFEGNYTFTVNGALVVGNAAGAPVTFTSSKSTPALGDWGGIVFKGTGSCSITNAVIEYATNGITVDGVSAAINNTVIRSCYCGIMMQNDAAGTVSGNTIIGNTYGIWLQGTGAAGQNPLPAVNNNGIHDNTLYNLYTYTYNDAGHVTINATSNWWGNTDVTTISAKIYDHLDNTTAPKVDFTSFLASAGGASVGTPTLPVDLDFGPTSGMLGIVNITNGLVVQTRSDFAFATPNAIGLGLTAVYNSRLARQGAMGYGWTHSLEASLQPAVVVNGQTFLRIIDSGGQGHYFQDAGGGNYQGAFFEHTSVRFSAGVYTWTLLNGTTLKFDSSGKLTGTGDAVGNTLTLAYDGSSRLSTVRRRGKGGERGGERGRP